MSDQEITELFGLAVWLILMFGPLAWSIYDGTAH